MKMNNLLIFSVLVCGFLATNVHAHFKMNGMNNVTGALSRNGGQFSTATDGCGGATTWGTQGYTVLWPGQPLNLTWEMNGHAALPDFRIAWSPDGSETALFQSANYLVTGLQHNGAGVYNHEVNAPRQLCDQCTIQAWHTGYNWGGCYDIKIVEAPCTGKCASTGIVQNGKLNYNTGEIQCNSGYTLNSKGECTKSGGGGMSPAGAFFLSIFIILVVCILAFAILAVLRRRGVLPEKVASVVEKGENATIKAYHGAKNGVSSLMNKNKSSESSTHAAPASAPPQSSPTPTPTPAPVATPSKAVAPPMYAKGMQVQARYSGDNNFYKAIIKDINPVTKQVLVAYPEYNNEQEWVPESAIRK